MARVGGFSARRSDFCVPRASESCDDATSDSDERSTVRSLLCGRAANRWATPRRRAATSAATSPFSTAAGGRGRHQRGRRGGLLALRRRRRRPPPKPAAAAHAAGLLCRDLIRGHIAVLGNVAGVPTPASRSRRTASLRRGLDGPHVRDRDCFGRKFGEQPRFTPYTDIAAGGFHTCGVALEDGRAVCFGNLNDVGQAINPPEGTFFAVAAGRRHSCGLTAEARVVDDVVLQPGSALCWGSDRGGRAAAVGRRLLALPRATTTRARSRRRLTRAASGRMRTSRARRRQASPSRRSRRKWFSCGRWQTTAARNAGASTAGARRRRRARTRGTSPSPPAGRTRAPCAPMAAPPNAGD